MGQYKWAMNICMYRDPGLTSIMTGPAQNVSQKLNVIK